jgi:hypothetical protein
VLEQKAQELLNSFGYSVPPRDRNWSFFWNGFFHRWAEQNEPRAEYFAELARGQRPLLQFNYRQSPRYLVYFEPAGDAITQEDPPLRYAGDVFMALDQHGRLRILEAVPSEEDYASPRIASSNGTSSSPPLGWTARDLPTPNPSGSPVTFDARAAWTGNLAHARQSPSESSGCVERPPGLLPDGDAAAAAICPDHFARDPQHGSGGCGDMRCARRVAELCGGSK